MSAHKANVHYITHKDDYCHNAVVITANIEYVSAVLDVIGRGECLF